MPVTTVVGPGGELAEALHSVRRPQQRALNLSVGLGEDQREGVALDGRSISDDRRQEITAVCGFHLPLGMKDDTAKRCLFHMVVDSGNTMGNNRAVLRFERIDQRWERICKLCQLKNIVDQIFLSWPSGDILGLSSDFSNRHRSCRT